MQKEQIAQIAHETNRVYCITIGDNSQPKWEDAPQWQRDSAIAGVEYHLANPDAKPSDSHESWLKVKEAEGWTYGEVKDTENKTHPCFTSYDNLPNSQKAKDYIFKSLVDNLL